MLFRGTGTALVTPFDPDGRLDSDGLRRLVEFQIAGGVEALIVMGTTGENPTISGDERKAIVDTVLETADGRIPIVVGTGSNDTAASVRFARQAAEAGAQGQLVVGPFYNKPTQTGFQAHVEAIAHAVDLPIILYNVPGRTGFSSRPETVLSLAHGIESVIGVKEASGDLAAISDILAGRPADFAVYAGDDELAFPVAALGGDGVVSVIANALPRGFSNMVKDALTRRLDWARIAHFELLPAMRACFFETNPIPVKHVLASCGLIQDVLRLPLLPLTEGNRAGVISAFRQLLLTEGLEPVEEGSSVGLADLAE